MYALLHGGPSACRFHRVSIAAQKAAPAASASAPPFWGAAPLNGGACRGMGFLPAGSKGAGSIRRGIPPTRGELDLPAGRAARNTVPGHVSRCKYTGREPQRQQKRQGQRIGWPLGGYKFTVCCSIGADFPRVEAFRNYARVGGLPKFPRVEASRKPRA